MNPLIRILGPSDIPELLSVVALALGSGPAGERSEAWWRWKHIDNPFGPSLVLGAFEGSRLVGVRAFLRWELMPASGLLRCARAVDTATHPEFQGRGIFRALTTAGLGALAEQGTDLVFNTPNKKSGAGYLSMGWQAVTPLRAAIRPNGVPGALQLARALAGPAAGAALPNSAVHLPTARAWLAAAPSQRLEQMAQQLAARPGSLKTHWTPQALHWRFIANPVADYRVLADAESGDALFLRIHQRRGLQEAVVSLVCTVSGSPTALLRKLKAPALDYFIWRQGAPAMGLARSLAAGFVEPPVAVMTLMARQVNAPDAVFAQCTQAAQWRLEFGDLELL